VQGSQGDQITVHRKQARGKKRTETLSDTGGSQRDTSERRIVPRGIKNGGQKRTGACKAREGVGNHKECLWS